LRRTRNPPQPDTQGAYTLTVNSDLVLTNVVVRDKKTGEVVRGLTAGDFQVQEMASRNPSSASTSRASIKPRLSMRLP